MPDLESEGKMQKLKGKVQSMWGGVTDDDIKKSEGDRNKLVGAIKERTGQGEDEIRKHLDRFDKDED
ncbi:MAG TPA: CsbD family protein [Dehalococcoidia bacterium]|nr:CsbD family protein [Dehalococcoidia bacterium]